MMKGLHSIATGTACFLLMAALAPISACERTVTDGDIVWVTPSQASETLNPPAGIFQKPERGVFVDPRSTKQFEEGHLPDAISLPLPDMEDMAATALHGYDIFIVYDSDFGDSMARAGAKRLMALGYKNVFVMEGGVKSWKADGNTVATGPAKKSDSHATNGQPAGQ